MNNENFKPLKVNFTKLHAEAMQLTKEREAIEQAFIFVTGDIVPSGSKEMDFEIRRIRDLGGIPIWDFAINQAAKVRFGEYIIRFTLGHRTFFSRCSQEVFERDFVVINED